MDKAHGRWEWRTLTYSPGLASYPDWPGARQVVQRHSHRVVTRPGDTRGEVTYAVTSLDQHQTEALQYRPRERE